jgi:hypothetical protein
MNDLIPFFIRIFLLIHGLVRSEKKYWNQDSSDGKSANSIRKAKELQGGVHSWQGLSTAKKHKVISGSFRAHIDW